MATNSSINDLRGRVDNLSRAKRPLSRLVVAATSLICLLVLLAGAFLVWSSRRVQVDESSVALANVARMVAVQAESVLRTANLALIDMAERVERDGVSGAAGERLQAHLATVAAATPELHGLFVYGADGAWLQTSLPRPTQGNNSDREYFRFHKANPSRELHIGHPVRSRSSGIWIIPVSRRLDHADGSFAGVALVTLRVDFFERIYESIEVGQSGTVLFAMNDGTLLYRRPFDDSLIGHAVPNGAVMRQIRAHGPVGTAFIVSSVDHIDRLYSYRHLRDYPLVVAVGQSKSELLANWRRDAQWIGGGALSVCLLFGFLARRLIIQIRIRDRLHQKLGILSDELEHRNTDLATLAQTDRLTQLANRFRFDQVLEQELGRARRGRAPLSLILLDVDFFKRYNDSLGHLAGDDCLGRVAAALAQHTERAGDLAARYGGEEFAVILPSTAEAGALAVAERLRDAIRMLAIPHPDSQLGMVTASFGVVTAYPTISNKVWLRDLVEAADRQLYRAKRAGRDRVCGARLPPPA